MAIFDWPVMGKATVNVLKTLGLVAGYLFFLACSSNCVAHAGQKASSVFNSYFILCYILWLAFVPFAFLNLVLTPFLLQAVVGPLSAVTTSDIVNAVLAVLSAIIIPALVWFVRALFARLDTNNAQINAKIDTNNTQTNAKIDDLGKKVDGFVGSMHQVEVTAVKAQSESEGRTNRNIHLAVAGKPLLPPKKKKKTAKTAALPPPKERNNAMGVVVPRKNKKQKGSADPLTNA